MNTVVEENEENNLLRENFYLQNNGNYLPDLEVEYSSVNPPTLNENKEITFKVRVINNGFVTAIGTKGQLYWSSSENFDDSAQKIGDSYQWQSLHPYEGTSFIPFTATLPEEAIHKTLYVHYKIDDEDTIDEESKDNNIKSYLLQTIGEAPKPNINELETINSFCSIYELTAPKATDDMDGEIIGTTNTEYPIEESKTIIWKYEDSHGNTSEQLQEISITKKDILITQDGNILTAFLEGANSYQWVDCATNDDITDANYSSYIAEKAGNYAVKIKTEDNCEHLSQCFNLAQLHTDSYLSKGRFTISPNPIKDHLIINPIGINDKNIEVKIYSIEGKLVKEIVSKNKSNLKVDVSSLKKAIYIIAINGTYNSKLIKLSN